MISALRVDDKEFNIIKTETVENPNPPPESEEEESDSEQRRGRKRKGGMNGGPDAKYGRHDETGYDYDDGNYSQYGNVKQEDGYYPQDQSQIMPAAPMSTADLNEASVAPQSHCTR